MKVPIARQGAQSDGLTHPNQAHVKGDERPDVRSPETDHSADTVRRVEALNQDEEFKLALARKVTQYIVHASIVCRHVQCWLHFLRFERLDRLLCARTLKVASR
jgi:hypothetical protein